MTFGFTDAMLWQHSYEAVYVGGGQAVDFICP